MATDSRRAAYHFYVLVPGYLREFLRCRRSICKTVLVSCFCALSLTTQSAEVPPHASDRAVTYLDFALDLMQRYSLRRDKVDWPSLRRQAFAHANGAQSTEETYPAITYACVQRDNICNFEMPLSTSLVIQERCRAVQLAAASQHGRPLLPAADSPFLGKSRFTMFLLSSGVKKIAYIGIPAANGPGSEYRDPKLRHAWAERLFQIVSEASQLGVQGWILDVRGTTGGYLAPMIAGLAPLLGDGTLHHYSNPTTKYTLALSQGRVYTQVGSAVPYLEETLDDLVDLHQQRAPVVFLLDRSTGGASEGLAIAFEGRPYTRFIGQHTAGFSNGGAVWPLSDGATLTIATALVMDRRKRPYPEGVTPDEFVPDPTSRVRPTDDADVAAALSWLKTLD